jgi:hypothetical protein
VGPSLFNFIDKHCWVIHEAEYDKTRSLEGNSGLGDLPATLDDAQNAKKIARKFGVPEKNIVFLNKTTVSSFKTFTRKAVAKFTANSTQGNGNGRTFLMVYVAGHGVADQ